MIELNTAAGWSKIYGITILDPSGFGEITGSLPYIPDEIDEITFNRSMWRSCFKVDDMAAWSSHVDQVPLEDTENDPVRTVEPRKLGYLTRLRNLLLSALSLNSRRAIQSETRSSLSYPS